VLIFKTCSKTKCYTFLGFPAHQCMQHGSFINNMISIFGNSPTEKHTRKSTQVPGQI